MSEKETLARRVEDCLRELAEVRERNQELEGEMSKAARIGKREEMTFEEEARTWAGVWVSDNPLAFVVPASALTLPAPRTAPRLGLL